MRKLLLTIISFISVNAIAQTDASLFWRSDSLQVDVIDSQEAVQYKKVGHHGPAVENPYMAIRLYFNNSGAIDIYSKAKPGLELKKYLWYPSNAAIEEENAGCDEYRVGKTVGLGGISLWDGEKEIKLEATKGRKASVKAIKGGHQMTMLSRGVMFKGTPIDIEVTVTVDETRWAKVEARAIGRDDVQFLTGVNLHNGQTISASTTIFRHTLFAGGIHPADVVEHPLPIYSAMKAKKRYWKQRDITSDMLRLISKPTNYVKTYIATTCLREIENIKGQKEINENEALYIAENILGI